MVVPDTNPALQRRLDVFTDVFRRISNVDGAVVELGVRNGATISLLARLNHDEGKERAVWGFDAWRENGETSWSPFKPELIMKKTSNQGVPAPEKRIQLVKGWVEDTLPVWVKEEKPVIALLHIDVGTYKGYKAAMKALWPRMAVGGVVIMDEYHLDGPRRAVSEYLSKISPRRWLIIGGFKYLIVKKG